MSKRLLCVLFAIGSILSSAANAAPSVYGKWYHEVKDDNFQAVFEFDIQPGTTQVQLTCTTTLIPDSSAVVSVKVNSEATDTTYSILTEASEVSNIGVFQCPLYIGVGNWNYTIAGDHLTLITPNSNESISFHK